MLEKLASAFVLACALGAGAASIAAQETPLPGKPLADVLRENNIDPALVAGIHHRNIRVVVLPADDPTQRSWISHPPDGPDDVCVAQVANPAFSTSDLVSRYTGLPRAQLRQFTGPDLAFRRILLHELRHCGKYGLEENLAEETDSDLFAMNTLLPTEGGEQMAQIMKYVRTLQGLNIYEPADHATSIAMEASQSGRPLPDPEAVEHAYDELNAILRPYAERPGGWTFANLDRVLQGLLAQNAFAGKPLVKRAAELYVEGIAYLAPEIAQQAGTLPFVPVPR